VKLKQNEAKLLPFASPSFPLCKKMGYYETAKNTPVI